MRETREPLYWESTYAIAKRLMEEYPEIDPVTVGTRALLDMILALPDFADEAVLSNDGLLVDILGMWYEEAMYS